MTHWLLTEQMENSTVRQIVTATVSNSSVQYGVEVTDQNQAPAFYSVGPGGGGAIYNPAINPQDGDNVFLACDMGSHFGTHDGKHFHNPMLYSSIGFFPKFFFSPHNENIVYASTYNVVHISYDKGKTWNYFFPLPDAIAGVTHDGGYARPIVKTEPLNGTHRVFARSTIMCVYAHPQDPNTVFVFSSGAGSGAGYGAYSYQNLAVQPNPAIHVTRNGGLSWEPFNESIPGGRILNSDILSFSAQHKNGVPISPGVISGDGKSGSMFIRAEMMVFQNELHLLSVNGYFRFNQATGALLGHNIYRSTSGQFHMSKDGKTITAYQIIRRDDFSDSYNNAGHTTFPGYVAMKLAPFHSLYPKHIFKTTDGGKTFELLSGNFATDLVYTFHGMNLKMPRDIPAQSNVNGYVNLKDISVSDNGTLCVVFSAIGRPTISGNRTTAWSSGVAKTTNNGQTWEWIQAGNGRVSPSIQFPSGVYPMHSADPGHNQRGISVSKSNPRHIITVTAYTAVETRDGGLTWRDVSSSRTHKDGKNFWTTNGIEPAGQMTLGINPWNKQHHLAGWTDIGMWESLDGGKSWTRRNDVTAGTDVSVANTSAVAFDPHSKNVVLAAFPQCQRDAMRGNKNTGYVTVSSGLNWETAAEGRTGAIFRSIDNGATWKVVKENMIVGIDGLVFNPALKGTIYAGTIGGGVWRSTDNGLNWHAFNTGMSVQERTFSDVKYRGIQIQRLILGKDNKTLLALLGGLSTDAATTTQVYELDITNVTAGWREIPRPNPSVVGAIWDMDKTASGVLYMAPMARMKTPASRERFNGAQVRTIENGGAFVSENNGQNWRQIFDSRIDIKALRSDSRNENILYLGGMNKMWMSNKGKETVHKNWNDTDWIEIPGFHFANPDLIVEDPVDPTRIYVTTYGGGTWNIRVPDV